MGLPVSGIVTVGQALIALWVEMLYCSEMLAEQETEKSVDL